METTISISVKYLVIVSFVIRSFASVSASVAQEVSLTEREIFTCEKEQKLFKSWSWWAGNTTKERALKMAPDANIIAIQAGDGRVLRGLQFTALYEPLGAVLVMPGNAWIAQKFAKYADIFVVEKLDVYVMDYRGYGLSKPGIPSIHAIIKDYSLNFHPT